MHARRRTVRDNTMPFLVGGAFGVLLIGLAIVYGLNEGVDATPRKRTVSAKKPDPKKSTPAANVEVSKTTFWEENPNRVMSPESKRVLFKGRRAQYDRVTKGVTDDINIIGILGPFFTESETDGMKTMTWRDPSMTIIVHFKYDPTKGGSPVVSKSYYENP